MGSLAVAFGNYEQVTLLWKLHPMVGGGIEEAKHWHYNINWYYNITDAVYNSVGLNYFDIKSRLKAKDRSHQEDVPLNSCRPLLLSRHERHVTYDIDFLTPVLYIIQRKLHITSQYFRILTANCETDILSSLHNRSTEAVGVLLGPACCFTR